MPTTVSAPRIPPWFHVGAHVALEAPRDATILYRVEEVEPRSVLLRCWDGTYAGGVHGRYASLTDYIGIYRPATAQEQELYRTLAAAFTE